MPRVWICFDAHRPDGCVWAVRAGNRWHVSRAVDVQVPVETVYRGPTARQPRAYLVGAGTVTGDQDRLVIR